MGADGAVRGDEPVKLVVRLLDELASRATAPAYIEELDGWRLRVSSDAPFRRANSVLPNGELEPTTDLARAITTVEELYAEYGAPARFHISPAARPSNLDKVLAARGYVIEAPVVVMGAGATIVLGRTRGEGRITTEKKRAWERSYASLHGDTVRARERVLAYGRALHAVRAPAAAVVAPTAKGEAVALGFAVAEQGWTGVFGMGTRPEARRQGAATAVLRTIAEWAVERGAARRASTSRSRRTTTRRSPCTSAPASSRPTATTTARSPHRPDGPVLGTLKHA
jgi:GNAT superfamily N-acetyltransferase